MFSTGNNYVDMWSKRCLKHLYRIKVNIGDHLILPKKTPLATAGTPLSSSTYNPVVGVATSSSTPHNPVVCVNLYTGGATNTTATTLGSMSFAIGTTTSFYSAPPIDMKAEFFKHQLFGRTGHKNKKLLIQRFKVWAIMNRLPVWQWEKELNSLASYF